MLSYILCLLCKNIMKDLEQFIAMCRRKARRHVYASPCCRCDGNPERRMQGCEGGA